MNINVRTILSLKVKNITLGHMRNQSNFLVINYTAMMGEQFTEYLQII